MPRAKDHNNHYGVYVITDGTATKIGIATDARTRMCSMQSGNPRRLTLHAFVRTSSMTEARRAEIAAHEALGAVRALGEWFNVTPVMALAVVRAALDGKPDSYGSAEAMSRRALAILKRKGG